MNEQELFRKFVKEVVRQIKPAILGEKWYEIYKVVGFMPDCECWKASLLGTLNKLKISKLAFANMFLILSRVEDDFDLFMQSRGFEKLIGRRFFEEMGFCLIEGLKLNPELADRAIILKSDIAY